MKYPEVRPSFSEEEYIKAHTLLASMVARMMGRKLEEGDWSLVYCTAKSIPYSGWSNLNIDVIHQNLGVEHKMLRVKSDRPIKDYCGTSLMHPAATRSIRVPTTEGDPTEAARDVLAQYAELIQQRYQQVTENAPGVEPDLRTGWLLWQGRLREFLYFEEEMLAPNPRDYWAEWRESGGGARKTSRNLWVYENETGKKRYSITTSAGAKIQPYFDVPSPKNPNLYYFCVQGEQVEGGLIRIWVTSTTARILATTLGSIDTTTISTAILECAKEMPASAAEEGKHMPKIDQAIPILITKEAYIALAENFPGVSDEHLMQIFIRQLS